MDGLELDETKWFGPSFEWLGETALPPHLFKENGVGIRVFVYKSFLRSSLCALLEACGALISGNVHGSLLLRVVQPEVPKTPSGRGPRNIYSHKWVLQSIQLGQLQRLDRYVVERGNNNNNEAGKRSGGHRVLSFSSSREFTDDMDSAILELVRKNAVQLEVQPQSPMFWRTAWKELGFKDCTWEEIRARYLHHLCETGEEDHQSGTSEGDEDADVELEQQNAVAQENKLMKMLQESSTKPRIASRRLAEKKQESEGSNVMAPPVVVDVRKDLMNGKGWQVFGHADQKNNISNGHSAEEMVARLAREAGVSHKVALHGLLVCGGNASNARLYLSGKPLSSRPWTAEEDALIRQATDGNAGSI
jgi:hypothetical protein